MRSRITGVGFHVPERVVTNHDLAKLMDTSDEWIVERTGIRERRFVEPGIGSTDLAEHAALAAIADAGREVREIEGSDRGLHSLVSRLSTLGSHR